MDAWKPEELKKMQCGGNGKFNAFLKKYGVEKNTDINKKYNSKAAEVRESNRGTIISVVASLLLFNGSIPCIPIPNYI